MRSITLIRLIILMLFEYAIEFFHLVNADVIVISHISNYTTNVFSDLPANFGEVLPYEGLSGCVVSANPPHACENIDPPPVNNNCSGKWIVLIRRFECNFVDKVRAAQNANYDAAIIYNVGSNLIEPMAGNDADDITIPSVFIGQDDGLKIDSFYQYDQGFFLLLTNELPFNINSYLLPFAIVVAICFAIMVVFMLVKCFKDRRRLRRYRMPMSYLKTIPTSKFNKGDPYDTCAICLEDYVDGDKLRILPCSHAYHTKCIDPWLTRNRRVCPVCKRRVIARGENLSDIDSDSEDETRPLLQPGARNSSGGTFSDSGTNINTFYGTEREIHSTSSESNHMEQNGDQSGIAVVENHERPLPETFAGQTDEDNPFLNSEAITFHDDVIAEGSTDLSSASRRSSESLIV